MNFELKQHFQIESARFLPFLEKNHPCSRTHGHSFKITLTLQGPLDKKLGWLIDYNEIEAKVRPILMMIDHCLLNEVPGLNNPTSELIALWLFEKCQLALPQLTRVTICETTDTECSYPA